MDIVEDIGDLSFDSGFGSPKRDTALTTSTGSRGTLDRSLSAKDFKDDLTKILHTKFNDHLKGIDVQDL